MNEMLFKVAVSLAGLIKVYWYIASYHSHWHSAAVFYAPLGALFIIGFICKDFFETVSTKTVTHWCDSEVVGEVPRETMTDFNGFVNCAFQFTSNF